MMGPANHRGLAHQRGLKKTPSVKLPADNFNWEWKITRGNGKSSESVNVRKAIGSTIPLFLPFSWV